MSHEAEDLSFLESCDPRIRTIYEYWDQRRDGRRMPSRADIDPVEIPSFLPNIILVDILYDPERYRYRLVGTDIVEKRGFDPTGQMVGEAYFGSDRDLVLSHYRHIAKHRTIRYLTDPYVEPRGWYVYSDRLMMPLSDNDDVVNMVIIYALWRDAKSG